MSKVKSNTVEKNQAEIRKLSLLPENRICMDCQTKSTPNVVLDFGIFVCTSCAGLHRKYQFKVKGISMTNFKDDQVEFLKKNGNLVAHKLWRGNWDQNKYPRPKPSHESKLDEFIRLTYQEKRFYSDIPEVQPITKLLQNPETLKVIGNQEHESISFDANFDSKFDDSSSNDFTTNFDQGFGNFDQSSESMFTFKTNEKKLNLDDLFGSTQQQQPYQQYQQHSQPFPSQQYPQQFQQQYQQQYQQQQQRPLQFHQQYQQYPQQQYPQHQNVQQFPPFQQQYTQHQQQQYQQQYPQQQYPQQQYQQKYPQSSNPFAEQLPQQKFIGQKEKKTNTFEDANDPFSNLSWK